ncbi:uncharacterized protein LOC130647254 [Hydractinia symbiolongicarpus]|uniref:uncharacterized protein LOC130647254 n=1 Tax=Hydractinia symbiolongicarpus TaxID=13093 RepID=UPI00254DC7B1|nr:uncharacterized protein LOC130647254 [Hydractinia symbiolongicarpus]
MEQDFLLNHNMFHFVGKHGHHLNLIQKLIEALEENTCLTFRHRVGSDETYLEIWGYTYNGCSIRKKNDQVKVKDWPLPKSTEQLLQIAVIMMAKCLGIVLPTSRVDRDKYVDIDMANVILEYKAGTD